MKQAMDLFSVTAARGQGERGYRQLYFNNNKINNSKRKGLQEEGSAQSLVRARTQQT